jgi:hypothetical protein
MIYVCICNVLRAPGSRNWVLDSNRRVPDSYCRVPDSNHQVPDSYHRVPDSYHRVQSCAVKHAMHHVPNFFLTHTKNLNHLQCSPSLQKFPTTKYSYTIIQTLHIIYILKHHHNFKIFKSTQIIQNRYNQHTVGSDSLNIYICNPLIYKNNIFLVSRILTLAALNSRLKLYIEEPIEVSNYDTNL